MTTPEWSGFMTDAVLDVPEHGVRPKFDRKNYDSKGFMKKEVVKDADGKKPPEEEQSFFGKYWMYILIAFMVLPRLFGPEEEGGQGQAQRS